MTATASAAAPRAAATATSDPSATFSRAANEPSTPPKRAGSASSAAEASAPRRTASARASARARSAASSRADSRSAARSTLVRSAYPERISTASACAAASPLRSSSRPPVSSWTCSYSACARGAPWPASSGCVAAAGQLLDLLVLGLRPGGPLAGLGGRDLEAVHLLLRGHAAAVGGAGLRAQPGDPFGAGGGGPGPLGELAFGRGELRPRRGALRGRGGQDLTGPL